jgi:hypothetical protein
MIPPKSRQTAIAELLTAAVRIEALPKPTSMPRSPYFQENFSEVRCLKPKEKHGYIVNSQADIVLVLLEA